MQPRAALKSGTRILIGYNQLLCAEALVSDGRFSLSLFEDLNKLIEAVVLYDKVVVLGGYNLPSGILAKPLEKAGVLDEINDDDVRRLMSSHDARDCFRMNMIDVFGSNAEYSPDAQPDTVLNRRISPNIFDSKTYDQLFQKTISCGSKRKFQRSKFAKWIERSIFETRDIGGHFYYMARSVLYSTFAEMAEMDYAPDLLRLPIAALSFSRGTPALSKRVYDALVAKVQSEIEALTLLGMPVAVFIPPLTAKLLSRSVKFDDYATELLELRQSFSGFRKAYGDFMNTIKDPTVKIADKIEAKKQMISRITGIIDRGESRHALYVKTVWDKLVSSNLDESGVKTQISFSGAMSLLLEQLSKERAKGRARAIFDLWTDTMNMKEYGQLIARSFRTSISTSDVERYENYSQAVRGLIAVAGPSTRLR